MTFVETFIKGVFVVAPEFLEDNRGFFARAYFCESEFANQGLVTRFTQGSISFNKKKGTIRGMHFQITRRLEKSNWFAVPTGQCST